MRVTTKGQVTIPMHIREKLGIIPASEVDFVEEEDRVYIVKKQESGKPESRFRKLKGIAGNIKMTTDEIMALTRHTE